MLCIKIGTSLHKSLRSLVGYVAQVKPKFFDNAWILFPAIVLEITVSKFIYTCTLTIPLADHDVTH